MTLRTRRTGFVPVRRMFTLAGAIAAFAVAPVCVATPAAAAATVAGASASDLESFYEARDERPLWFADGQPTEAANALIGLLSSASLDGLDPQDYDIDDLERALDRASTGKDRAVRKADRLLSRAFVAYARDLRSAPASEMRFIEPTLRPGAPSARWLLDQAADARSLAAFIRDIGWLNPAYAQLRKALASGDYGGEQRDLLRINMERARVLPTSMPRFVIVNAAAQRLDMYEGDRLADSMKVVVGKEKEKDRTPMMASLLSSASLNPYWNVPPDLAAERIAPNVLKHGVGYLERQGYQVLSDWSDDATIIDPGTVDWQAVADGTLEVRVRQLPGRANALGKVKYTFSNPYGVYLHDTPDKKLLTEETRLFSGGCIRLEDAARFGEWLFGYRLEAQSDAPDIPVRLERPVPVYVTYLTAIPDGSSITFLDDVYGWDKQRIAAIRSTAGGRVAAR